EAVRRRLDELAETNRHKDEFLAMLSHELRNPLAAIVSGLSLLRAKDPPGDGPAGRARAAIERQVQHLRRLVDDLLDVSRIGSGKIELRRTIIPIQEVVKQA